MRAAIEAIGLTIRCPRCGAYGWCVTQTGHQTEFLHSARTRALYAAHALGYRERDLHSLSKTRNEVTVTW